MKKTILLFLATFFLSAISFASTDKIDVTGRVTDTDGQPVAGASIIAFTAKVGTSSDADGNYSISVDPSETLEVSCIGYKTQTIKIPERTNRIDVVLEPDAEFLNEVVVVGYGSQARINVTGAVSKIKMEQTEQLPNTNIGQTLRGRIAGVQFTDNARPGQNGSILIRGPRSLSAGNSPLIVLDGTIYEGVLSDINPNDISSMEVLKDASASAIYGSRAANGVILITSKKGTSEKPQIRLNVLAGFSGAENKLNLLSPSRYLQKVVDYRAEEGLPVDADANSLASYMAPNEGANYLAGKTIDPYDIGTQKANIQTYDLSISGKSKYVNYYMSANYSREKGIIINDNQNKISLRANLEANITPWLRFGTNTIYARRDFSGVSGNLEALFRMSPFGSLYDEDEVVRRYVVDGEDLSLNVLYQPQYQTKEQIQNNLFSTFFLNIDFPFVKGLSYRLNFSPNIRWTHNYNAVRQDKRRTDDMTTASKNVANYYNWVAENILNYNTYIGKNHFIDATLMFSRNASINEGTVATAEKLSSDKLLWNNLALGTVQKTTSSGSRIEGVSYMARLNYRLMDRYLATVTVRRDGCSVFATNNKYATFPSVALSWIMSQEPWMRKLGFVDMLKLRVSYGSVGNQAISAYQSLSTLGTYNYVFGDGGTTSIGYYPKSMANSELKWETTYTANVGVDFELFAGRLGGTIELYNMDTKDLLMKRTLPSMAGFSDILTNLGQINNKGIEITINSSNIRKKDFEWSTDLTFSYNRNKIVHLYGSDTDGDGKEDDDIENGWFIGQPITTYYDYVFDGIWQEGEAMPSGTKAGDPKVKDSNGDGSITSDDREIIGHGGQPDFRIGLNNTFKYKNFTLSFFINSMLGWIKPNGLCAGGPASRSLNFLDMGWWTPANKSNTRPSLTYNNPYNVKWYYSRNFARIQDVSFSYDLPQSLLSKVKISTLRVILSAKNLYTFTSWPGVDPETGTTEMKDSYPMPRTVTLGINIGF